MIIFNYERLEQFLKSLNLRASDEVFSKYQEPHDKLTDTSRNGQHELILQFLGHLKPQNTNLLILHQCVLKIKSKNEREEIIQELQKAFNEAGEISLIEGSINEIFVSIS